MKQETTKQKYSIKDLAEGNVELFFNKQIDSVKKLKLILKKASPKDDSLITGSTGFYYVLNEHWGFHIVHNEKRAEQHINDFDLSLTDSKEEEGKESKAISMEEILSNYKGVEKSKDSVTGTRFIASNEKGHYLEIIFFGGNEIRYIHDNFPFQRRIFSTNIPYKSIDDFESDMNRMNIPIMGRLTNPKLFIRK